MKVLLAICTLCVLFAWPATAFADNGVCTVADANQMVKRAEAKLLRAQQELREAKRVLAATKEFSSFYGSRVGRWVNLCRRSGFSWPNIAICMKVINRESRGDPKAFSGYYAGLWQMSPSWWLGRFDPYDPVAQTRRAARSVDAVGWVHWPTAYGRGR